MTLPARPQAAFRFAPLIFAIVALLFGCSRHSDTTRHPDTSEPVAKYESAKLDWAIQNHTTVELGLTNNCLVYVAKGQTVATDVYSLQQATEMLGQYGWQFVSSDSDNTFEHYHLQRQVHGDKTDGYMPIIFPGTAKEFRKQ